MRILEVIEEIRVVLRDEFDVETQPEPGMSALALAMLKALFPLLPLDLEMLYRSYKEHSLYSSHSGEPNCDWLLGSVTLFSSRKIVKVFRYWTNFSRGEPLDELRDRGPVKSGTVWREAWMPLAGEKTQFFACDMDPDVGGFVGQIIFVDIVDGSAKFLFKSITEMLEVQLVLLKSGERDIFEAEEFFING